MARLGELQQRLAERIRERERDELVADLLSAGVPVAPVLDRAAMLSVPHFAERGVVTVDEDGHPATGHPVRFVHHPAARHAPAPSVDEHRGAGWL